MSSETTDPHESHSDKTSSNDAEAATYRQESSVAIGIRDDAQRLIDGVNEKRKHDSTLIEDIRKQMDLQMEKTVSSLEQHMYTVYDKKSKVMQAKLADLFATLDRISQLEAELEQFKQALGSLYQEVN